MNCPHCDTHVDEHHANRCFAVWIHIDVMGYGLPDHNWEDTHCDCIRNYPWDIAAVFMVLQKLEGDGWEWRIEKGNCVLWRPEWVTSNLSAARPCIEGKADSTEHAICRAAVKAYHA